MSDSIGLLARDPYSDPTPCGGANKVEVREEVRGKPSRENAIEPRRLLSAATIVSEKVGHGQYRVQSRSRKHIVYNIDVYSDQPCDCEDSQYGHGRMCAHWLHCRMREGDELTLLALGQVIVRAQKAIAEYLGTETEE